MDNQVKLEEEHENISLNSTRKTSYLKYYLKKFFEIDDEEKYDWTRMFWYWSSFFAGSLLMIVSGTQYLFSVYSPELKSLLDYNQKEINLVGTFGNFGIYFGGVLPGFFFDRYGPRLTCLIGAILNFAGYFGLWIFAKEGEAHYIVLALCLSVMGIGSSATYSAALGTSVRNTPPKHSGKVVGFLVSLFGICAAVFTQIYIGFFKPDVLAFILFLAISLGGVSLLGVIFIQLLSPITKATDSTPLVQKDATPSQKTGWRQYLEILKLLDFWIMLSIFGMVAGAGFVIFNNLGNLVLSLGGAKGDQDEFVIILSVFSCFGRLFAGLISDKFTYFSRPTYLLFPCSLMCAAYFWLAFSGITMLYVGVIAVGLAYGSLMSISPLCINEFWGSDNFAGNWAMVRVSPGLGSFFFSTLLAGYLYDYFSEDGTNCVGQECYQLTFFIMSAVCLACTILAFLLIRRRKRKYVQIENQANTAH